MRASLKRASLKSLTFLRLNFKIYFNGAWPSGLRHSVWDAGIAGSNPVAPTAGVAQLGRATAFQAVGRGFEARLPLNKDERDSPKTARSHNKKANVYFAFLFCPAP